MKKIAYQINNVAERGIDYTMVDDRSLLQNSATITGETFSNLTGETGAAINNAETLQIVDSTFSDNSATSQGGAVFNAGTLGIIGSEFTNNTCRGGLGGAIKNTGNLELSQTEFSGNSAYWGGGLDNSGTAQISHVKFSGNNAGEGGGIYNTGKLMVSNSTFSCRAIKAGGGVFNKGTATIENSTFTGNYASNAGGGALNNEGAAAQLVVNQVSFIGNSSNQAGVLFNLAQATFTNSVFQNNHSRVNGGAIFNNSTGAVNVDHSVFRNNTATYGGGAIFNNSSNVIELNDVTFSGNTAPNGGAVNSIKGTIIMRNVVLQTSSDTIYNSANLTVRGNIAFADNEGTGVMLTNEENGTLNFDLSNLTAGNETAWISDWSRVDNSGNITITVNNSPMSGIYRLAEKVANFAGEITVKTASGAELGTFNTGADKFKVGEMDYSLTRDKELTLTITDGSLPPPPPLSKPAASDIDGNGISDVMFQYTGGDNQLGFWMNGTDDWQGGNPPEPKEWKVIGAYDMDNSGKADVVMLGNVEVNGVKGAYVGYRKDGDMTTWENISFLSNPDGIDWKLKVGNVTGNPGKNSLVWHAPELGAVGVWLDGTSEWKAIDGYFDKSWTLLGTGDFNGDGKDEILFQNGDGYYTVDLDSNFRELGHTGAGWTMCAIGDYSGDGKDDLVFFHQKTGSVMMYQDGTTFKNMGQLDAKDWFIVGAGDYNGDQQDDLLVRQYSTGMLGYYASGDLAQWVEMGRGVDMNWTVIA